MISCKNLKNFQTIIEKIIKIGIQRKSKIYSFGGGTVGDFSGFLASSLLRGIDHIMIPTSLLAMVDSSIGGKTGINSKYGKNLIGSFYLPKKVLVCPEFIKTLPKREIACGFAEVIKYSLIKPHPLKEILEKPKNNGKFLFSIIENSIKTKLNYVSDFREKSNLRSSRAILNFGHTIGHSLEGLTKYGKLLHGEAVSIGMVVAANISKNLKLISTETKNEIVSTLNQYGLPTNLTSGVDINDLFNNTKNDKKVKNGIINWVLLKDIGSPIIKDDVPDSIVIDSIREAI